MPETTQVSPNGARRDAGEPASIAPSRRAVLAGSAALLGTAVAPAAKAVDRRAPKLRRGGSIHTMMNWADLAPGSRDTFVWPPFSAPRFLTPTAFLRTLAKTGIDFIRLTVDQGPFLQATGSRQQELDAILLRKCRQILDAGLDVVVDIHPINQVEKYAPVKIAERLDSPLFREYVAMLGRIAAALRALDPARVAFEPFNEPPYGYNDASAARWQRMMEIMHVSIRANNRDIAVIWSGAKSASISALDNVAPDRFGDDNIIWTFHYYSPHHFTHQGVRTSQPNMLYYRYLSDLPFPARLGNADLLQEIVEHNLLIDSTLQPAQRAALLRDCAKAIENYIRLDFGPANIRKDFASAAEWARRQNIPASRLFLGEFGAVRRTPGGNGPASRHRNAWLGEVRRAAEMHGFGWALWEINQPEMGIVHTRDTPDFDGPMLQALGLDEPGNRGR